MDACVMITVNIDIFDGLINGQIGTVKHVKVYNGSNVLMTGMLELMQI